MSILDASIVTELLVSGPFPEEIRQDLAQHDDDLAVLHLLDVEVMSVLRDLALV